MPAASAGAVIEDGQDGALAIERVTETVFEPYPGVDPDRPRPGLAFWRVRRGVPGPA